MRIANGYGKLKDETFRIAHMVEINMEDVDKVLVEMEEFLKKSEIALPMKMGKAVRMPFPFFVS